MPYELPRSGAAAHRVVFFTCCITVDASRRGVPSLDCNVQKYPCCYEPCQSGHVQRATYLDRPAHCMRVTAALHSATFVALSLHLMQCWRAP